MLYDELATTLTALIMRLKQHGETAGALDAEATDLIKAHQKTVLMVLDFEAQILKRKLGAAPAGDGGRRLNLDAARAEVAGRLARLAAAQGA
jgi:hypothetical protein